LRTVHTELARKDGSYYEEEQIGDELFRASLKLIPTAILATQISIHVFFWYFLNLFPVREGFIWLVSLSFVSLGWYLQVRSDRNSKNTFSPLNLLRHQIFSVLTAFMVSLGCVYIFPLVSGFDMVILGVLFVVFLFSGTFMLVHIPQLSFIWMVPFAILGYKIFIFDIIQQQIPLIASFTVLLAYNFGINRMFFKVFRERFSYKITAENQKINIDNLLDQSPVSIILTDLKGNILRVNKKTEELTGYTSNELVGKKPSILKSGDSPLEMYKAMWERISKGETWSGEFNNVSKDGKRFVEKAIVSPIKNSNGVVQHYMAVKEDITFQKNSEAVLLRQKSIIELLLGDFEHQARDWLWELDSNLRLSYISDKIIALGVDGKRLLGLRGKDILWLFRPPEDREAEKLTITLHEMVKNQRPFNEWEVKIFVAGRVQWLSLSATTITSEAGEFLGWRGVGRDISEHKKLEIDLKNKANLDETTGLPNRRHFKEKLEEILKNAPDDFQAILGIFYLGKLDTIRTELGSRTCNSIIDIVIRNFFEIVGYNAILARLSRDEFAFLISSSEIDDVNKIHLFGRNYDQALEVENITHQVGMHIGLAFYPDDSMDVKGLLRSADLAMKESRVQGRWKVMRYREDLASLYLKKQNMISEFAVALSKGQFQMYYQPQVEAQGGKIIGAESLIRWFHPLNGLISPGEFIPMAEQSGFIVSLGEWTLLQACKDAMLWDSPIGVSVNVSGVQLKDTRRLIRDVKTALSQSGLPPNRLLLEITESSLVGNENEIEPLLLKLRELGVLLALDDFGTGYSSLAYLQKLHLDKIKIDQSFVRRLGSDDTAHILVRIIIELATSLGLESVAEGVEDENEANSLRALGCHWFQGFLYGKPMPNSDFRERLKLQVS